MALIWSALCILIFLYFLHKLQTSKKNLPPGPIGLPIIGHLHLLGKNVHHDLCRLSRKHGPIMYMRLGHVPMIVVSSPAGAELVLKTHDLVFANRPSLEAGKYLSYDHKSVSLGRYGSYWRDMRKLCILRLLSNIRINEFRFIRKTELGLCVGSIKRAAEMKEIVDLSARVSSLSSDMICLMVFGSKYGDGDFGEKGIKGVVMEGMEAAARFNLGDYFPYLGKFDLQGLTRRLKSVSETFDRFLERVIDDHVERKGEEKETVDFVDTLMGIMESGEAGFEFDRRHVKAVLLDMYVAGHDTSATVVEWIMSELIRHPTVMKKLQNELETVVGKAHMVEESHLDQLEYLSFVVKETLRLHPIVPLLLPHESMEDCVVDGFHIPKNSRVMVNVWAIGRDPNVWTDPEIFLPERFIGSNIDLKGHDFQLIPFGSGRRGCPGMQLGHTVVRLVVAQLVHCFDWELPNCMLPCDLDMSEHFGIVTARVEHLMAIPTYRLVM